MYIVNGKIYTDAALLDEIVYNTKIILNGIVVKNEKLALQYETSSSMNLAEIRFMCRYGSITFLTFPWTFEILTTYGYSPADAIEYLKDLTKVPEEDRDDLLAFGVQYFMDNYIEMNKYYRSLMGLPEYNKTDYDIYLTPADFPESYDTSTIDFSIPLHEYPSYLIDVLQGSGKIAELIEQYRSFNYSYLRYLGSFAIDVDKAREASKWDILYIPPANADVQFRFQELYEKNKSIYLTKVYQDAYAIGSDYYDNMMIFMLLAQTFNDMIVDVPEWFIRKDIFDIRTVQFFLEAYGVTFFKEIPLKYQIKIVKNINRLIMSKSTIENFHDIIDIFQLRETHIYRYYLYKRHKTDSSGHFIIDDDPSKMYELEFIEVLLGDTYDNFIKDESSRIGYDEVTLNDQYWDGGADHEEVKNQLYDKDFIIEPTKYITIKADIIYSDFQKQLAYFLSMVFDSRVSTDQIYIPVPSISESVNFSLTNLLLFVEVLSHLYSKTSMDIIRPEDVLEDVTQVLPDFEPDRETDDWWMQERYTETFTDKTVGHNRVFGFNPEANVSEIMDVLSRKFTNYSEKNFFFTPESLHIDSYITPPSSITTIEELMDLYENNISCLDKLEFDLTHGYGDKDKYKVARYVYEELFTKPFDYNFYTDDNTLIDTLSKRDYTLYTKYQNLAIKQQSDPESASIDINAILSDIVTILSFYINRPSLDYLFANVSNTSFEAVLKYIYWMLNIFKSYKLHLVDPVTKYIIDKPNIMLGNNMEMADTIMNRLSSCEKYDHMYMWDKVDLREVVREVDDHFREKLFEILDIFTIEDRDPNDSYIYIGGSAATEDSEYSKSANGGGADEPIPFKILNGFRAYNIRADQWNVDFNKEVYDEHDHSVLRIDGGNVLDQMFDIPIIRYQSLFRNIYDFGIPATKEFINNNFFLRVIDTQNDIKVLVATRTGLLINEVSPAQFEFTEYWREWKSVNDFEILNDTALIAALYDEGRKDLWYQIAVCHELPYGRDYDYVVNHPARRVSLYDLDNLKNQNIIITIEDVYPDGNNITDADWNFGSLPDNPGNVPYDCNFGELPDDPGNVDDDYEFGEISDIYYISKLGNYDTSRVINIPRISTAEWDY